MSFAGRHVLIAGGAGNIGTGITLALLQQGAKVTVTTRSMERFQTMKAKMPASLADNLFAVCADVTTEDGVKTIFDQTTKADGGVQHVVASIGSFWQGGKLADQSVDELNKLMNQHVIAHFQLFKQFINYLDKQQGSTYTMLTGNSAENYIVPGISLLCIISGGLMGMATAACAEHKDSQVAFAEFRIQFFIQPKADSEIPESENDIMGHDVMGQAIVSSMLSKTRGHIIASDRAQVKGMVKLPALTS